MFFVPDTRVKIFFGVMAVAIAIVFIYEVFKYIKAYFLFASPENKVSKATQTLFQRTPQQGEYSIPENDSELLAWVQGILHLEGFKLLAYVYDSPSSFAIGSSEKRKGFRVASDAVYGKFYKVEGRCFFLNPSWYNGSDAYEIFLKYGLIELWVESVTGNFYALTPKCEELILRVRRLAQSKAEDINNPPQNSPLNLN